MESIQQKIIKVLHTTPTIKVENEVRRRIDFLKEYMMAHPFLETFVLGISGGQDSTLAGRLAQLAVEELREETGKESYQFIAVRLPYGVQADEDDCQMALSFIQPDKSMTINIKDMVTSLEAQFINQELPISDFNKGNIKARARMISQYTIAGQLKGAVIGTDHAAEAVTGFYTKFGDGAADLVPLFGLNKGQGKELLAYLGAPAPLYEKIPTADLEEDKPQLPDEEALGVTYEEIDAYLEGKTINKTSQERIEQLYHNSEHKRHLPISLYDTFWKA